MPARNSPVVCQILSKETVAGAKAVPSLGEQDRHVARDRAAVDAEFAGDAAQHVVPAQAVFPKQASHLAAPLRALEPSQGLVAVAAGCTAADSVEGGEGRRLVLSCFRDGILTRVLA
jgi:hypothetical protein